jgi:hypothetical protein
MFSFHVSLWLGLLTDLRPSPVFGFVMEFTGTNRSQSGRDVTHFEIFRSSRRRNTGSFLNFVYKKNVSFFPFILFNPHSVCGCELILLNIFRINVSTISLKCIQFVGANRKTYFSFLHSYVHSKFKFFFVNSKFLQHFKCRNIYRF